MHIPDNFLSTPVWATLDAIAVPTVAVVSRKAHAATDTNRLPLLGVMGAFVFAAQMINFPVGVGTSGHLVGGTLLACILGPWAAALVVTSILMIQALVFQDGGVLALGANVINMALLGVMAGYLPAKWLVHTKWRNYGVFVGGLLSVLVSGVLALSELTLSGVHMPTALLDASLGLFLVNAVVEGAITVSVLRAIEQLQPGATQLELGSESPRPARSVWKSLVPAFALASILLASVGVLIASTLPDGLEHLAKALGIPFGGYPTLHSPLSEYQIQALGTSWLSRAGAGLIGLLLIYLVCALGGHLLGRGRRSYS
ncbi:MAG TPA: energy-coupling factor ABC transporter permease [Bryobacteraceae bacterium]|nr:energy-coupling factor ABC transporter permease [Bryobacteraceae bacterium]